MENSISKILIGTMVKKTLNDIKTDPERSIRNLVDMALQFSSGRFQHRFFSTAQQMLRNERSSYYDLIRNAVADTDTEQLYTFSMNLGYNGCTAGARKIRENENKIHCNIPWTVLLHIDTDRWGQTEDSYQKLILEGECLGIYVWSLFADRNPQEILSLAQRHPDSAFFLLCEPGDITSAFLEEAQDLNNLMLVVRYDEDAADIYDAIRSRRMHVSVWYPYGPEDVQAIVNGDLFYSTQQVFSIFTILLRKQGCPDEVQRVVYQSVERGRKEQTFRTVLWELYFDNCLVDRIISDEACFAYFDRNGVLQSGSNVRRNCRTLFDSGLTEMFMEVFPKKGEMTE